MSTRTAHYITVVALVAITAFLGVFNHISWTLRTLIVLPSILWLYRSCLNSLVRLEQEKTRSEGMADLHVRTIEALALAIEGEDQVTPSHLRRVEVYAVEVGKELGLDEPELQALRAAALLHDIGKLAVPEHIVSKPGALSAMEFEKMKIHPVVGAEILEQVEFPYPVAPIVRAHHEKWDGTGYPLGLRGEDIPIGARILAAVDCLDALSWEREYRQALPLSEALRHVSAEAGKSFDPRVVSVLERRHAEFERMVEADPKRKSRNVARLYERLVTATPRKVRVEKSYSGPQPDFLSSIAAARQEAQNLFELMHELGASLSLDETLSVLAQRLKRICPYDSVAFYIRRGDKLIPEYVHGENFQLFSSLEIPVGEGLSGWVAQHREPIVNGNPSVEPGYLNDAGQFSTLNSALSVPLEGLDGVVGVMTLYHSEKSVFTRDHLRVLQALTHKIALSIENALRYQKAETCATTDSLTGLPNARSLFLHLDSELARCRREDSPLTVLVCDLDGFKNANDRFGHLEGNKLLRAVAAGLREHCREYDYVARMGGDEFVVVLPGHPPAAVREKVRLLADVVVQAGRDYCGEDLLSMSVGDAMFPVDGSDAEQLLSEADRRMYQAKHNRRPAQLGELGAAVERASHRGLALVR